MSRSTVAKSRQEKTSKVASAPTPAVTHEIVPGKFNDQDWNSMLDQDDGDDFITGIVEEVCSFALNTIFENYIERQLIPYTVTQAKDALLQIIEWQFLARDAGEGDISRDVGWAEDEEPEPAVTDCWAQGSVPRTFIPTPLPTVIAEDEDEVLSQHEEENAAARLFFNDPEMNMPIALETEPTVIVEEKTSHAIEEVIQEVKEDTSRDSKAQANKRKKRGRGYKPHTGPVRTDSLNKLNESLEKTEMQMYMQEEEAQHVHVTAASPDTIMQQMPTSCQSILKLQAGRPPGNRDVVYDAHGNVVSVNKLDPEKLPSHSVKTKFTIVDPSEETKKTGINLKFHVVDPTAEASQSRSEAMRKGKAMKPPHPPTTAASTNSQHSGNSRNNISTYNPFGQVKEGITPLPPPLLESMVVAPGVMVREGDRVKRGPRQRPKQAELISAATKRGLRAIHIRSADPSISVTEILQNQQPIIRPMESVHASPIPPISPNPHRSPIC